MDSVNILSSPELMKGLQLFIFANDTENRLKSVR